MLLKKIFSIKNEYKNNKKYKTITILGLKIKKSVLTKLEKAVKRRYNPNLSIKEKKLILEKHFFKEVKYLPDIDNPKTFNEKLQWLKLNDENPLLTKCADKYLVRDYVKEKIGKEYLIPLLGVWDKPEDIDFDKLPNQFVLKVNWGSGQNIIVKDKSKLDIQDTIQKLNKWIAPHSNHYYAAFEWCYKNIQPKIIAEQYIEQMDGYLVDYKIHIFEGNPFLAQIIDRWESHKETIYKIDSWQKTELHFTYELLEKKCDKLPSFEIIQKLSEELSKDFCYVRADFYDINSKIYFGELTFYPGCGFLSMPLSWDKKLGDMLTLSERANKGNKNGIKL